HVAVTPALALLSFRLTTPRPPTPPLFPYTTLFRSRIVGISGFTVRPPRARREKPRVSAFTSARTDRIVALRPDLVKAETRGFSRSEEHTSELQSLAYLVCRLLLEKKKTTEDVHSYT